MSALLDQLCGPARLAACASHEPSMASPTIGAWDSLPVRSKPQALDPIESAQASTYAARQAIRAIRAISEREVVELLTCIQARIAASGWDHTVDAKAADEALTDCIWHLENQAKRSE